MAESASMWVRMAMISLCAGALLSLAAAPAAADRPPVQAGVGRGIDLAQRDPVPLTPFAEGQYRALLIGNDLYRDPQRRWPALRTAVADARTLAEVLRSRYGFGDVELLENATRREILHALAELSRRVMPRDSVLVYYAGHGWLDTETNKGYWVPVDAEGADHTTFLRNSTIRDELSILAARSRHTLLISDSCFSGTLLGRGNRAMAADPGDQRYYRNVAERRSAQILTAGGVEFVDDDYRGSGHSPFTYFLLNELRRNDQPLLTASELSSRVEKAVANNVSQTPASGVLQGAGDELGEFIFLRIDLAIEVEGVPADRVRVRVSTPESTAPAEPAAPAAAPPPAPRPLTVPTL